MIQLIPAIDIIDGKCVRLSQGDYNRQKTYNENPLEVAKSFQDHGLETIWLPLMGFRCMFFGGCSRLAIGVRICRQ